MLLEVHLSDMLFGYRITFSVHPPLFHGLLLFLLLFASACSILNSNVCSLFLRILAIFSSPLVLVRPILQCLSDFFCLIPYTSDHAIIPYRIMDCIDVENRIDLVQWPVLPVFNPWQNLIRHIRNLNIKQKNSPAPATSGTGDLSYFILFSSLKIQSMSYRSVYRKS